jgi:outer membrane protein
MIRRTFVSVGLTGLTLFAFSPLEAEQKLGYIDSQVLREKLPEFKDIQRKLERLEQQYTQEATDRQSRLESIQEDFRKQELLMSEARKVEMQQQFDDSVRKLREFTQEKLGPNGELFRKNVEFSSPIFDMVNTELEALAKSEGYDFIFDVAVGGAIVFADPERFNLTEELLERLREKKEEQEKGKK